MRESCFRPRQERNAVLVALPQMTWRQYGRGAMAWFDRLKWRGARRAIRGELAHSEHPIVEGVARFWFTDGVQGVWPEVYLVATENRLLWAMVKRPDAGTPSMRFDQLVSMQEEGSKIMLTEADPQYAERLQDPSNPHGETDAIFDFGGYPESAPLLQLIRSRASSVAITDEDQPWKLLGLEYPTSPINHPYLGDWVSTVEGILTEEETLVEFGMANEVDMLSLEPGTSGGEGTFAVTNLRSLFSYEAAPQEIPDRETILEIPHELVETCRVEKGWATPSGEIYGESDAPSHGAVRSMQELGVPEMAVVKLVYRDGSIIRRLQFVTGRSGGANWAALIERFRRNTTIPEGWEPPRI